MAPPCDWNNVPQASYLISDVLRAAIIDPQLTNAFRLLHGASDGWSGLYVNKFGDHLLAETVNELNERQQNEIRRLAQAHAAHGVYHKLLNRNVRRMQASESSPQLIFGESAPDRFTVHENGLSFDLSFNEGYSVGLFLDQRDNRRRFLTDYIAPEFFVAPAKTRRREEDVSGLAPLREVSVLNIFAYTCSFSVAAAKAGAHTTSIRYSQKNIWSGANGTSH